MKAEECLAADLVAWLRGGGWDVYEEVETRSGFGRADVVAVKGSLVHVIEAKVSMGLAVLSQAARWRGHANLVSVATRTWGRRSGDVSVEVCEALGVGWYGVGLPGTVLELAAPRLTRRTSTQVRRALRPEHQTYARAGSNGGFYSAFRGTVARLVEAVRRAESEQGSWRHGVSPAEVCASIVHHYATARSAASALTSAVERGLVPELEVYDEPYGRSVRRRIRSRTGGGGNRTGAGSDRARIVS